MGRDVRDLAGGEVRAPRASYGTSGDTVPYIGRDDSATRDCVPRGERERPRQREKQRERKREMERGGGEVWSGWH